VNLLYLTTAYEHGITGNPLHEEFLARFLDAGHDATVLAPAPLGGPVSSCWSSRAGHRSYAPVSACGPSTDC
jgi:hypothetical protein